MLLLYVSANSGHQRASMAIEKAVRQMDRDTEIAIFNYLAYISPLWERTVTHIYFSLIKVFPRMWNRVYDHAGVSRRISPLTAWVNKRQQRKFNRFLKWFVPDVVVCTQAFPCGVVARFKKEQGQNLKLVAVVTDFIAHIYWVHDEVDIYVVATEESKNDLINKGVDDRKIRVLGIPIDPSFAHENKRSQVAANLGFSPAKTTVLIIGGGQGYGPIEEIVREILKFNLDIQLLIVTGTNELLKEKLTDMVRDADAKDIKVFGFVTNISEIMDVCDVLITKPGGLTTAEAMAKGIPMILTLPIPGQEDRNRDFFVKNRMAFAADSPGDAAVVLKRFLAEPQLLNEYKRNISREARPGASLDIAREVLHKN